jgi:hypothetical protein
MDKETERVVREIVNDQAREETAEIMANFRKIKYQVAILRGTLLELEEVLRRKKK